VVLDREEGRKIAECLGDGKAAILQNHGLITVSTHSQELYISISVTPG
jgi:ribulose-5-phosphate 4-epimerase/fuculose-1-phosphate aldolase